MPWCSRLPLVVVCVSAVQLTIPVLDTNHNVSHLLPVRCNDDERISLLLDITVLDCDGATIQRCDELDPADAGTLIGVTSQHPQRRITEEWCSTNGLTGVISRPSGSPKCRGAVLWMHGVGDTGNGRHQISSRISNTNGACLVTLTAPRRDGEHAWFSPHANVEHQTGNHTTETQIKLGGVLRTVR